MFYMCPFSHGLHGWLEHLMDCSAEALDKGRRVVPPQLVIYTSSIDVFLALYEHRHLSLPCCPIAAAAPKSHGELVTACCKHSMGSKVELG